MAKVLPARWRIRIFAAALSSAASATTRRSASSGKAANGRTWLRRRSLKIRGAAVPDLDAQPEQVSSGMKWQQWIWTFCGLILVVGGP